MTKADATKAIVKEIINKKHPNLELRIFKKGEQTFQDLVSEVKSTMKIDGLTLNERFRVMFDNPQSEFQKSMRWEKTEDGKFVYKGYNVGGKNPEAQRVLDIIRIYETAAKDYIFQNAYVEYGGRVSTIANLKEYTTKIEFDVYHALTQTDWTN